jgi:hypothetical protein
MIRRRTSQSSSLFDKRTRSRYANCQVGNSLCQVRYPEVKLDAADPASRPGVSVTTQPVVGDRGGMASRWPVSNTWRVAGQGATPASWIDESFDGFVPAGITPTVRSWASKVDEVITNLQPQLRATEQSQVEEPPLVSLDSHRLAELALTADDFGILSSTHALTGGQGEPRAVQNQRSSSPSVASCRPRWTITGQCSGAAATS